jgi:C4-dicarboxylate-specific signal transduction histidine kinase
MPVFMRNYTIFIISPTTADTLEYRLRRKDGAIRWVREHIQNVSVNGRPVYVQGIVVDINEMKELDLARQRAEMVAERSRRLSSLGTLAGGIAHEINQPLTAMKAGVDGLLMLRSMDLEISNEQIVQTLESVSRSIQRIEGIIQHMRMLMRKSDQQPPQALHIDRVVEQALSLFEQKMTQHGICLARVFPTGLPMVEAHAVGLEQAVANLLGNAIDALDAKEGTDKRITVRTGREDDSVWCEVEDNGPGVPESIRDLLFDPFVSTKDVNRGMGLGLTIVENLVSGMNGVIRHADLAGGGAVFRILLPIADTKGQ